MVYTFNMAIMATKISTKFHKIEGLATLPKTNKTRVSNNKVSRYL